MDRRFRIGPPSPWTIYVGCLGIVLLVVILTEFGPLLALLYAVLRK